MGHREAFGHGGRWPDGGGAAQALPTSWSLAGMKRLGQAGGLGARFCPRCGIALVADVRLGQGDSLRSGIAPVGLPRFREGQELEGGERDLFNSFDRQAVDTPNNGLVRRPKIVLFQCAKA